MNLDRRLSVALDSYAASLRDALRHAAGDGFAGVQLDAQQPDLDLSDFGRSAQRHLKSHVETLGVRLDGLMLLWPDAGLADGSRTGERVLTLRKTLELARALGVNTVSASIGASGAELSCAGQEVLEIAADLADRTGVRVALTPPAGLESALAAELRALGCPQLALGVDAAMELSAIRTGAAAIGAVYLRDVRRSTAGLEEVPVGRGQVDFAALAAAVEGADYGGPLTLRQRPQTDPVDGPRRARETLRSLLAGR